MGIGVLMTNFLTVDQLAKLLAVKKKTIYGWVETEKIPYHKFVGSVRFSPDEIKNWVKARRRPAKGK